MSKFSLLVKVIDYNVAHDVVYNNITLNTDQEDRTLG